MVYDIEVVKNDYTMHLNSEQTRVWTVYGYSCITISSRTSALPNPRKVPT